MYAKLGEKLAEKLESAQNDDSVPAPKRKASDSPGKASKARKSA